MKLNFLIPSLLTLPREACIPLGNTPVSLSPLNAFAYDAVDTDGLQGLLQNYLHSCLDFSALPGAT